MVDPTPIRPAAPEVIYELMDLVPWIETYCLDKDGNRIKLLPWQKALLYKLQNEADKRIADERPR